MKTRCIAPALVWDLDGTVLDSYPMIVAALEQYYRERGLTIPERTIRERILRTAGQTFAAEVERETGLRLEDGMDRYQAIRAELEQRMDPIPGAADTLRALRDRGARCFVLTHRGASSFTLLDRMGLAPFFEEIVTARDGSPRKPDPAGLRYLMEKYALDPARTWYVGDRSLDVDCAVRAGARSILYRPADSPVPPTGREDFVVTALPEILTLPL
jgi:HAD superfamily hydrolase (TIGR01549 family)